MDRRDFNLGMLRMAAMGGLASLASRATQAELRGTGSFPGTARIPGSSDPRLEGSCRFSRGRWIYVHLEGTPSQIGFQHGYLLAPEIADGFKAVVLTNLRGTGKNHAFFRRAAKDLIWPRVDAEYQEEIRGVHQGLRARGVRMELDDVIWLNAMEELADYYVPWYDSQRNIAEMFPITSPGNCSAFVATGSATRDRQVVIGHNAWTSYLHGERWNIIFDIVPQHGHHILMDGYPGVITSDDDFGLNGAGMMITETTISQFHGWNPDGKPEFARARKAMQYATSIDDYVRIMLDGNNGGYANDWLLGDRKTGEIALFELGLKAYRVWRTKDGFFVSSNEAQDAKVLAEDTTFDPADFSQSPNARRVRWHQLMKQWKGQIDITCGQHFLSDHYDTYLKKEEPSARTLCGHGDLDAKGVRVFVWSPYYPGGSITGKVADSRLAGQMSFIARRGHPCGSDFLAKPFLKAHPQYAWQEPMLHDMLAGSWTVFASGEKS